MHTLTTDLSAEQVKRFISEIVEALGLSSFPLNDHSYQQREDMTVIAEISSDRHRSGAMHAWIVGYADLSRTMARVMVFPHEWASFDIGTQAIYDEFIRLVSKRVTPVKSEQSAQVRSVSQQRRTATEHDRIRTTLMTWAADTGRCSSYSAAAAQLGSIDIDTRRNHEKRGWLYTESEIENMGGYEYLWQLYTTELRKN